MLTRCPKCATTFRITSEQLKARQGRVRCGACQEVFSALDTLIEEVLPVPATPSDTAPIESPAEPLDTEPELAPTAETEPLAVPEPLVEPEPEVAPDATVAPEPTAVPELPVVPEAPPVSPLEPEPLLHEAVPSRKWPWAVGMGIAALFFAAQAAIAFRTEIIVLYPEAKPAFAAACEAMGCELRLPRKAELVGIETSDLHPDAGGRLTLVATLKNRAPFAQEYPHLELTLTDTGDQPLVRRVLAPAEYLLPQAPGAAGFGANTEIAVNLAVEAPGVPAAGYRLYLFYP